MDNLDNVLQEREMTKVMLAERLGIKKQALNSLLKNPTLKTIRRIAEAVGVSPARLFVDGGGKALTAEVKVDGVVMRADSVAGLERIVKALKEDRL